MKNKSFFKFNIKHKRVAFILALVFLFSVLCIDMPEKGVYAAGDGDSTEEVDPNDTSNVLTPKEGRVTFWEWEKVTKSNYKKLLGDKKYHAALFTKVKNGTTKHISTYADDKHIFHSQYSESYSETGFKIKSIRDYYDNNDWGACIGQCCASSGCMDQYASVYIKQDEDGWNKVPSNLPSKFFTTEGGCMGALWIKCEESSLGDSWTKESCLRVYTQVGLTRGSAKGNDLDTSYYSIGTGVNEKDDIFLYCRDLDRSGEGNEPTLATRYKTINDLPNSDRWSMVATIDGNSMSNFCLEGSPASGSWDPAGDYENNPYAHLVLAENGYLNPLICRFHVSTWAKIGQVLGAAATYGLWTPSVVASQTKWTDEYFDCLYIGTPHNFTSLESQTVPEGKLQPYSANHFPDEDGNYTEFEGYILPRKETLTIDGGTAAISGNFINNGTIRIINGGTLIVKDGGCISPYTDDAKGNISCEGGNIIIMEGGRICCFNNKYSPGTYPLLLTGGSTIINYGSLDVTSAVIANGCKIENRKDGFFSVGYERLDENTLMYNTDAIEGENLKAGSEISAKGYSFDYSVNFDNTVTYRLISKSKGNNITWGTLKEEDIESFRNLVRNGSLSDEKLISWASEHGYIPPDSSPLGLYGINGGKATVVNEKTATFSHWISETKDLAPSDRVDIIVPEY